MSNETITAPITNLKKYAKDSIFLYRLLSRLQADCEFYLNYGSRNSKHLWALDETDHINEMLSIYMYLEIKPEWLSLEQIKEYSRLMNVQL